MLLSGKVCIVTGAASPRSIGHATAELFAEHGAKVVVVDLVMDERVHGMKCDIASVADCERVTHEVVGRYGTIDCLVNSAAIVQSQPLLDIAEADFGRMVDVNLKGTFNICKSVLKVFAEKKRGAIVNLASVAAQRGGGLVGGAHYAASKGGVISLTKAIAREFGPMGIRANVICPSMTETGMLDGNVTPEMFKDIIAAIPLRRAGRAVDIAGACLFLASDLSAYVTGATLDVNGGSHIH